MIAGKFFSIRFLRLGLICFFISSKTLFLFSIGASGTYGGNFITIEGAKKLLETVKILHHISLKMLNSLLAAECSLEILILAGAHILDHLHS